MRPFRSTGRLMTSLLVALAAGTAVLAWLSWPAAELPPGLAVPTLAVAQRSVDRIELRQGAQLLTLERRGQLWYLAQHGGYPANSVRASALLEQLGAMVFVHRASGVMETLGLDDPGKPGSHATLVRTLSVAGHGMGSLILGRREGSGQYVRRSNDFEAWLADRFIDPDTALASWTDPLILPPGTAEIASGVLDRPNEPPAALSVSETSRLAALAFDDVRPIQQVKSQGRGTLHYVLADGTMLDVELGMADSRTWLRLAATGPGADPINHRVAGWAYAVSEAEAVELMGPDTVPASQ